MVNWSLPTWRGEYWRPNRRCFDLIWFHPELDMCDLVKLGKKNFINSLSFVCFSAGFCAVLRERHRWNHSVRRLRPTHRHLWHLQKVQHLDARGREWHTHTPQQRENKEIKPPVFSSHVDKSVLSVWPRTAPSWPTLKLAVFYLKPEIRKSGAQAVNHGLPHLTSPSWFLSLKELCVNEEAASAVTGRRVY